VETSDHPFTSQKHPFPHLITEGNKSQSHDPNNINLSSGRQIGIPCKILHKVISLTQDATLDN
jgi:hypothetical protein